MVVLRSRNVNASSWLRAARTARGDAVNLDSQGLDSLCKDDLAEYQESETILPCYFTTIGTVLANVPDIAQIVAEPLATAATFPL